MDTEMTSRSSLLQSVSSSRDGHTKLRFNVFIAWAIACLGSLSFGFILGYSSPVNEELRQRLGLGDEGVSWFGSIHSLGGFASSLLGSYLIDKFGRKATIMLCSVPFVIGWVTIAAAKSTLLLLLGRFITGVALGVISLTVPVYIAEISPAKYRGALGSGNQLIITLGTFMVYSLGAWFKNFRWLAIASAVPPTLMIVLMIAMPETPRWLVKKGRMSEAIQVMKWLRGGSHEDCEEECQDIVRSTLGNSETLSLGEIKKPTIYRPFILCVSLMVFRQLGGLNVVLTYAATILRDSGFDDAITVSIVIAAVQFVATGIACLTADKLGRRKLLIFPGLLMSMSMVLLGFSQRFTKFPDSVVLLSLSLFITGFALGWGPIPWLVMSEIFPLRVRGIASGIATQINWLSYFLVVYTFSDLESGLTPAGTFWLYGVICLLSAIFVFFLLPETKGRTLEEIEGLFKG